MGVAAHDDCRIDARERGRNRLVGCDPRQDRLVVTRCGMAENHVTETVDFQLHRRGPGRDEGALWLGEALVAPAVDVTRGMQDVSLAIAGDERSPRLPEQPEAFGLHRAPEHVTADDDLVGAPEPLDVREHRLEGREVPVHVVQCGDLHAYSAAAPTGASMIGGGPPSRGPAQTTSSAGQPEHANRLGVGRKSRLPGCVRSTPTTRLRATVHRCARRSR